MTLQERDFNSSAPRGERADHPEAAPRARDPQPRPYRAPCPGAYAAARPGGVPFSSGPRESTVSLTTEAENGLSSSGAF